MAVPKKKTSKARRDKRRAQHKIESPRLNVCPQCGRPVPIHCEPTGGPPDPRLKGSMKTDRDGRYEFRSIRPNPAIQ